VGPVSPAGPTSPCLPGASTILIVLGMFDGEDIFMFAGVAVGTILTSMAILNAPSYIAYNRYGSNNWGPNSIFSFRGHCWNCYFKIKG
jgi:hypothetical protein